MQITEYYESFVRSGKISEDSGQEQILSLLEKIGQALVIENAKRLAWSRYFHRNKLVKGLYLYGGVGIGKTFLMDCFFETLPFVNKLRMHFHQFMQLIHQELTQYQGQKDPLAKIASDIAKRAIVICFDEFFVSDITDAMLLGRLLQLLFTRGVCLIATSNVKPDDLYQYGLQRSRFKPAITLLNQNTHVKHLSTSIDYRLRHLQKAGVYYMPLTIDTQLKMEQTFAILAKGAVESKNFIDLNGRNILYLKKSADIIWFDFIDLCSVPRSQVDYLELSKLFKTVFLSNLPQIAANEKDKICLFVNLVDVFYDAKIKLIISAAVDVFEIYPNGFMKKEFERTKSRLLEMQSKNYFGM